MDVSNDTEVATFDVPHVLVVLVVGYHPSALLFHAYVAHIALVAVSFFGELRLDFCF